MIGASRTAPNDSDATSRGFVSRLLFLLGGPLIWFAHFNLIYGVAGFGAALGVVPEVIRLSAWVATAAATVGIVALLWSARDADGPRDNDTRQTMLSMTRGLAALSLLAVLLQGVALSIIPQ